MKNQQPSDSGPPNNVCANCCRLLDVKNIRHFQDGPNILELDSLGVGEIIIDSSCVSSSSSSSPRRKSKTIKIKVFDVLSSIYKLDYLKQLSPLFKKEVDHDEEEEKGQQQQQEIAICSECSFVLTDLYKLYEKFKSLSRFDSFVNKELENLDTIINVVSSKFHNYYNNNNYSDDDDDDSMDVASNFSDENDMSDEDDDDDDHNINSNDLDCDNDLNDDSIIEVEVETLLDTEDPSSIQELPQQQEKEQEPPRKKRGRRKATFSNSPTKKPKLGRPRSKKPPRAVNPSSYSNASTCTICSKSYKSPSDLIQHLFLVHTPQDSKTCVICKKSVTHRYTLVRHYAVHFGGNHICHICNKSCITPFSLKLHIRRHVMEKSFLCDECGTTFKYKSDMVRHSEVHSTERRYLCHLCPSSFKRRNGLEAHHLTHIHVNCYACTVPNCGQTFTEYRLLQRHLQTHVTLGETTSSILGVKPKKPKLKNKTSETEAVDNGDDEEEKEFKCQDCPSSFHLSQSLQNHIAVFHSKVKDHICPNCGLATASAAHLRVHMMVHTGERPYKCGACSAAFKRAWPLKRHLKTHTGEKMFKCQVPDCDYSAAMKDTLKIHLMTHTGKRPYSCHVCKEEFWSLCRLKQHFLKAHPDENNN